MTAAIIDGKAFAARLRERVATEVAELRRGTASRPGLAVVLVGDDPASEVYVRNKDKAEPRGRRWYSVEHRLPAATRRPSCSALVDR